MCCNLVPIFKLNSKLCVRQVFNNLTFNFYNILLRHML